MKPQPYRVERHGGAASHNWRVAFRSFDGGIAGDKFRDLESAMRQGGVRLVSPAGEIIKSAWAPRLRSRW